MQAACLHIFEQHICRHLFRHEISAVQHLLQIERLLFLQFDQKVLCVQDSDDIIEVLSIDRKAGNALLADQLKDLFFGRIDAHRDHFTGTDHDVPDRRIIKFEDIGDPFFFIFIQHPGLFAEIDHHPDLLFTDLFFFRFGLQMQQAQDRIGRERKKRDDRPHDEGDGAYDAAGELCYFIRFLHRDPLRHKLTEDQCKI